MLIHSLSADLLSDFMVFALSITVLVNVKISPRTICKLIVTSSSASVLPLCASAVFAAVVYGPLSQGDHAQTQFTFDVIMNVQVSGDHTLVPTVL